MYFRYIFLAILFAQNILSHTIIEYLESHNICPATGTKRYPRRLNETTALVVNQSRLNDHALAWNSDNNCTFQVKAGDLFSTLPINIKPIKKLVTTLGIVVIIQHLYLRQNQTTGECIDYVQFKAKTDKNLATEKKYCGRLSLDDDSNLIHLFDRHGKIDTHIKIDKRPLHPNEQLELALVYTPVKILPDAIPSNFLKCNEATETLPALFIHDGFINDTFFNCPSCIDEGGCQLRTRHSSNTGTLATVAVLSIMIVGFVIFLSCIWFCKKFSMLCWTENFASSRPRESRNSVELDMHGNSISVHNVGESTTPSFESVNNKDLPPPYESLFPDR